MAHYGDGELNSNLIKVVELKMDAGIIGSIAYGAYGCLMEYCRE